MRILIVVSAIVLLAAAAPMHAPYAGQQNGAIKALDAATLAALERGEGHGMALAGELNHYPGPRHVLSMADHLGLSPAQRVRTQAIYGRMHIAAVSLGARIIAKERQLDDAFKNGTISDASLRALIAQIADLNGQLRVVHLSAHLAVKRVLTSAQIRMYDAMRGYQQSM